MKNHDAMSRAAGEQMAASRWLFIYACVTALATVALLGVGGVVTSRGAGMAVPDWPTSYGYNMFVLPWSHWVGGALYEHSHRLIASVVGVLVVGLTRWLGGPASRLPLALIGFAEVVSGLLLVRFNPELKGAGHFLSGIGGVVLLGAAVWARHAPARRPLPALGWVAFVLVQVQGLLGGLRVVLIKDEVGIFHATLAQLFFVLVCWIALLVSPWWRARGNSKSTATAPVGQGLTALLLGTTALILAQLIIGATMRHQHAGLAIPDFPTAYGKLWPATDPESVALYNQQRLETTAVNPITAGQIVLQMVHRAVAVALLFMVAFAYWGARRQLPAGHAVRKFTFLWLAVIVLQALLGAATIWSNKAADAATAHVVGGATSLVLGAVLCLIVIRDAKVANGAPILSHADPAATGPCRPSASSASA